MRDDLEIWHTHGRNLALHRSATLSRTVQQFDSPELQMSGPDNHKPAEAELIESARKRAHPPLSIREAARRAAMSQTRWHQIAIGYQTVQAGVRLPVIAPAMTIARMASVVGVTPDQLREAGREDAAEDLESLLADQPHLRKTYLAEGGDAVAYSAPSGASEEQVQKGVDEVLGWALRMAETAGNAQRAEQIRRIIAQRTADRDDPGTSSQRQR